MGSKAIVELNEVIKQYPLGKVTVEALRGISLTLNTGEFTAIVGPSGSGKSTLLQLMGGLEQPSKGNVVIDGQDITKISEAKLTKLRGKKVGFIFKHYNLIPTLTAVENVEAAIVDRSSDDTKKSIEMLKKVGLGDRIKHLPSLLSGGEQQRVAIARALAVRPSLMLFDEPTSALDPELVGEVLQVMTEVADSGITMLIVTHEMSFARRCADRVIFIDGGKEIESGPPEIVLDAPQHARTRSFIGEVE